MQFKTKLGLVDIPNAEVLNGARDLANDGIARVPVLMDRIQLLEDLLRSARCIAQRKGEGTAWERFDASVEAAGVGSITARVYKMLPDDPKPALPEPKGADLHVRMALSCLEELEPEAMRRKQKTVRNFNEHMELESQLSAARVSLDQALAHLNP